MVGVFFFAALLENEAALRGKVPLCSKKWPNDLICPFTEGPEHPATPPFGTTIWYEGEGGGVSSSESRMAQVWSLAFLLVRAFHTSADRVPSSNRKVSSDMFILGFQVT